MRFNMAKSKFINTSSFMYVMVCTKLGIAHVVGIVSRFLSNPSKGHWEVVKWILQYLRGTPRVCLKIGENQTVLDGYTYSHMASDIDSRKSISRYLIIFAGGVVYW